ncbi:MAG: hypothetical protein KJ709_04385 [Nanoarchaeota archaeon]|nr:hypothetical protein [Nanoarchaeota archaeon]
MGVEVTLYAGADDAEKSEFCMQGMIHDQAWDTKALVDQGKPQERFQGFYPFPYGPKTIEAVKVLSSLDLFHYMKDIFRHDLMEAMGHKVGPMPVDGLAVTHEHMDHMGLTSYVRHDLLTWQHRLASMIGYSWQETSNPSLNQFRYVKAQLARMPTVDGRDKYVSGEVMNLDRNIEHFESEEPFKIGNMTFTPYLVDHSLPGACAFIIKTSEGKIAWSGDFRLRGYRPQDTLKFLDAAKEADFFFIEGSLLYFDHYGTEKDVVEILAEQMPEDGLTLTIEPPRDMDRKRTIADACKMKGKMNAIPVDAAVRLKQFNGENGYPKLSNRHIGVYLEPKGKGLLDTEEEDERLKDSDYYRWQRWALDLPVWDGKDEPRPQRVRWEDIREYQEHFCISGVGMHNLESVILAAQPRPSSEYFRLHPGPWTRRMRDDEAIIVNILEAAGIYKGPHVDYLDERYLKQGDMFRQGKSPRRHRLKTIHVTGHCNRFELAEKLQEFPEDTVFVPNHTMYLKHFRDIAPDHLVAMIERKKTVSLEELRKDAVRA